MGPLLITATVRARKDTKVNMCGEDAFYKIHYANWKSMYNERVHDEMIHDSRAYGDHVWNKLSHGRVNMVPKQSVNALDERTQRYKSNPSLT